MSIEVKNIRKEFGSFTALQDVSLDFPTGELVALLGRPRSGAAPDVGRGLYRAGQRKIRLAY